MLDPRWLSYCQLADGRGSKPTSTTLCTPKRVADGSIRGRAKSLWQPSWTPCPKGCPLASRRRVPTTWNSRSSPELRWVYAGRRSIDDGRIRVICFDADGSLGVAICLYADELATGAVARVIGRLVKYVAARLKSFLSSIHALNKAEYIGTRGFRPRGAFDCLGCPLPVEFLLAMGGPKLVKLIKRTCGPYARRLLARRRYVGSFSDSERSAST
jgi:hypothetical protein